MMIASALIVLLLTAFSPVYSADIYYTSCTNGHIENCHCPTNPLGASEKRTAEIERRREAGEEFILVDSGDFMSAMPDSLVAMAMIDVMLYTGYDAIGLGDQELMQGQQVIENAMERLPIVSANLVLNDGRPIGYPYKIVERDGITFFITALFDTAALRFIPRYEVDYFHVLDADSALAAVVAQAPENAKVILLSHAGIARDRVNADRWEGIDLIVGSHSQSRILGIDSETSIPMVQPGCNGRFLGVARFRGNSVRAELVEILPEFPDDPRIMDVIMELRRTSHSSRLRRW